MSGQFWIVYVPYNVTGAPQWGFANSDLVAVRESLRRYQGNIVFAGIYEFVCQVANEYPL